MPRELTAVDLNECIRVFSRTALPVINLTAAQGSAGIYDSKFGGTPYLPPGFAYPRNESESGKPLKLLCQLNFAELPRIDGFPDSGILQFYVANEEDEDTFGLDFETPTVQRAFRVVYHERVTVDEACLQSPPDDTEADVFFPVEYEQTLAAELGTMPIGYDTVGWDTFWNGTFKESAEFKRLRETYSEEDIEAAAAKELYSTGHKIGGYPFFTQSDPRHIDAYKEHSVLLLQVDTDNGITWGDCGVANFFIKPDDLAKRDFSNVLFNWDCC